MQPHCSALQRATRPGRPRRGGAGHRPRVTTRAGPRFGPLWAPAGPGGVAPNQNCRGARLTSPPGRCADTCDRCRRRRRARRPPESVAPGHGPDCGLCGRRRRQWRRVPVGGAFAPAGWPGRDRPGDPQAPQGGMGACIRRTGSPCCLPPPPEMRDDSAKRLRVATGGRADGGRLLAAAAAAAAAAAGRIGFFTMLENRGMGHRLTCQQPTEAIRAHARGKCRKKCDGSVTLMSRETAHQVLVLIHVERLDSRDRKSSAAPNAVQIAHGVRNDVLTVRTGTDGEDCHGRLVGRSEGVHIQNLTFVAQDPDELDIMEGLLCGLVAHFMRKRNFDCSVFRIQNSHREVACYLFFPRSRVRLGVYKRFRKPL